MDVLLVGLFIALLIITIFIEYTLHNRTAAAMVAGAGLVLYGILGNALQINSFLHLNGTIIVGIVIFAVGLFEYVKKGRI